MRIRRPVGKRQLHEIARKKHGVNLSITTLPLAWTPLSNPMYKLRTLLSTGFVDNALFPKSTMLRKALFGADLRATTVPQGEWRALAASGPG